MKKMLFPLFGLSCLMLNAQTSFDPEEARRTYGETSSLSSGYRESGDYLFFDIKWTVGDDDDEDVAEMRAMLSALTEYARPKPVACTSSPFCPELTSWMLPETFAFSFSDVASCQIEDRTDGDDHDVVWAFDLKPLADQKKAAQAVMDSVNARTESDWLTELKKVYLTRFKAGAQRKRFLSLLGCPIVTLIEEESLVPTATITTEIGCGSSDRELAEILARGASADSWLKTATTLMASGCFAEAVLAYVRALTYDRGNEKTWRALVEACEKAGLRENATGLSWYLKIR